MYLEILMDALFFWKSIEFEKESEAVSYFYSKTIILFQNLTKTQPEFINEHS